MIAATSAAAAGMARPKTRRVLDQKGDFGADSPRIAASHLVSDTTLQSTQPAQSSPDCWVVPALPNLALCVRQVSIDGLGEPDGAFRGTEGVARY